MKYLDEMLPWNDRLQVLECDAAIEEAPDVMTFSFRTVENNNWFRYMPGQFITIEIPVGPELSSEPVMRTYTLSSTPSRPYSVSITIKAQAGSIGTRWMLDNMRPGMQLKAFGPAGDFSLVSHPGEKYLFISAGSGITPMMSMTRFLYDTQPHTDIVFLNCARSPDEIIFRKELELLASRMDKLRLQLVVEQSIARNVWSGVHGRISHSIIDISAPDFRSRTVFCCGPEPFMRAVREMLEANDFNMDNFHQESFQPASDTPAQPLPLTVAGETGPDGDTSAEPASVIFTQSGMEVQCSATDTVLLAARNGGLKIPSACEFGVCGTCKVKCLSGETIMNHNGGIRDDEIEEGYILACCSHPVGRVEIDL